MRAPLARMLASSLLILAAPAARAAVHVQYPQVFGLASTSAGGGAGQYESAWLPESGPVWNSFLQALSSNANSTNAASAFVNFGWDPTYGAEGGIGGIVTTVGSASATAYQLAVCGIRVTGAPVAYSAELNTSSTVGIHGRTWLVPAGSQAYLFDVTSEVSTTQDLSGTLQPGFYVFDFDFEQDAAGGVGANFGTGAFLHLTGYEHQARNVDPPQGQLVNMSLPNPTLTLVASGTGDGPMQRQWTRNGSPLANGAGVTGATTDTLVIADFSAALNGAYACVYQNALSTDTSEVAVCEAGVVSSPPLVTVQPQDQVLEPTGNAFGVRAFSSGPLTYQWSHGGVPLADGETGTGAIVAGSQSPGLVIVHATAAEAGEYQCAITNDFATVTSTVAHLAAATTAVGPSATGALRFVAGPNPARGASVLQFTLPAAGSVRLDVFDLSGRRLATLEDGRREAGLHVDTWDLRDAAGVRVPPGLYLARLVAGGASDVRRLIVVR